MQALNFAIARLRLVSLKSSPAVIKAAPALRLRHPSSPTLHLTLPWRGGPLPGARQQSPCQRRAYLARILGESRAVLDSDPASFQLVESKPGFRVLTRPVHGAKGLTMARLEAEVPMRPDTLFHMMTSMDGKCIIDPFPREHHSEHVKIACASSPGTAISLQLLPPKFSQPSECCHSSS